MAKLRTARKAERDMLASAKQHARHRSMCRAYISGVLAALRPTLVEPQDEMGTRVHKEDARMIVRVLEEFESDLNDFFDDMRIVQHGKRDHALSAPVGADLSNVISFKDRVAGVQP